MQSIQRSLVVGAAGQVGQQLVKTIGGRNAIRAGRTPRDGWHQIDLAALPDSTEAIDRILDTEDIQAVYCVGGATDVERCETDTEWAMKTNHLGPALLAKRCAHIPFVYFSTEYVFDGRNGPYTEISAKNPISVYGLSKSLGEDAILNAHPAALIIRTTVVYGEDLGGKNFLYSLRRNLSSGQAMSVPNDQLSTPTYNRDLAAAAVALVQTSQHGIFHVVGPELLSRYDFAIIAGEQMALDTSKITGVPTSALKQKAPRPLRAGLLIDKLQRVLPEVHMRTVAEGVRDWLETSTPVSR
jgi:dTDP-4-dehydrorhamnose reductase